MSISRVSGSVATARASLMRLSVTPDMAETTTTILSPARTCSATRAATALMRSGLPTDVPPYFWTRKAIGERGLKNSV